MSVGMNMDFRWLDLQPTNPATTEAVQNYALASDNAEAIAAKKLAEHQAYLQEEEERRKRQEEAQRQQQIIEAAQAAKAQADAAYQRHFDIGNPYTMFNPKTASKDEIKEMQKMVGAKADGVWGPKSQAAFNAAAVNDDEWEQLQRASQLAEQIRQRREDYAKFQELKAKRDEAINKRNAFFASPEAQMALTLARGGQFGALQSVLSMQAQKELNGGKTGKTQSDMDQLEKSIMNDIFAISSTKDPNQREKLMTMAKMLYSGQLQDMLDNNPGLVSRLGGVEGIEALLQGQSDNIDTAKQRAAWKKEYDKIMGMRYPTEAQKKRLSWLATQLGI